MMDLVMRILNGGTNIITFKSFQILHLISLWVESWLISICGVAITSFPRSKKEAPRIRGAPRSRLSYPAFLSVEGSGAGKKRTDQIWFPQLPVNLGRRLLYHGMEWTVRRWFQGHVFKGLTLQPAHIQKKLCPTKFKNTVQENYLGMIGRWKATRGLFEAILFRGTLTAGAGKDISKLCLKLRVVGKRRWRNRPFWSPNCANPRPNRL